MSLNPGEARSEGTGTLDCVALGQGQTLGQCSHAIFVLLQHCSQRWVFICWAWDLLALGLRVRMGRVKPEIKKLTQNNSRQTTYSKRRNGLVKKAILCDIDVLLVIYSPGKSTLFVGQNSTIEEVIAKFCSLTPQERHKRKLESLEALKKSFKTSDHVVDVEEFLDARPLNTEELKAKVAKIQSGAFMLQETAQSEVDSPSLEQTRHAEERLENALTKVHIHKEEVKDIHTFMSVEISKKFSKSLPSFRSMPSHSDFLVAPQGACVKLGKRKCDYFGDDFLVAQRDASMKIGKRKCNYFGDDFLMAQQDASTKLGKRKCDYFGDDSLMAQQDALAKLGKRKCDYFGYEFLVAQQGISAKLGKRKCDYFGDDFLVDQQDAYIKLDKRELDYFGDATPSIEDVVYNCE